MGIEYLKEIAQKISKSSFEDFDPSSYEGLEDKIEAEIEYISVAPEEAFSLLNILFENNIPITVEFYDTLRKYALTACFKRFGKNGRRLMGILLVEACKNLPPNKYEKLLSLLSNENVDIFLFIKSLSFVMSEVSIPPHFATELFREIEKRIRGDLAGGDFYKAIEVYATTYPRYGLDILKNYFDEGFDDGTLHMSSMLLGYIRTSINDFSDLKSVVEEWDRMLKTSSDRKAQACYHRSWAFTFFRGNLSLEELSAQISHMISQSDYDEAFGVLHRCLLNSLSNQEVISFVLKWLENISSSGVSLLSKNQAVEMLWRLLEPAKEDKTILSKIIKILSQLLPIPVESGGAWGTLNYFLHDILLLDKNEFINAIECLNKGSHDSFLSVLEDDKFDYTFAEASQIDLSEFIASLLFSPSNLNRLLGVRLFQKLKNITLSNELIEQYDIKLIKASIISYLLKAYEGSDIARYLLLLEPLFQGRDLEDKEWLKEEMIYQAINYQGAVLGSFKMVEFPSDLLSEVITEVETYFERIKAIHDSPVNSFAFAGYEEAGYKASQDFSTQVSKGAKERSIFAQLVRNVDIIYGDKFSFFVHDALKPPTKFSEFSHSIEFPRLEVIDPEGRTLRRIRMIRDMYEIEDEFQSF